MNRVQTQKCSFAYAFTLISCIHLRQKQNMKKIMQKREQVHENVRRIFRLPFGFTWPEAWWMKCCTIHKSEWTNIFRSRYSVFWFAMRFFFCFRFFLFYSIQINIDFSISKIVGTRWGKKPNLNKLLLTFLLYEFHQLCVKMSVFWKKKNVLKKWEKNNVEKLFEMCQFRHFQYSMDSFQFKC